MVTHDLTHSTKLALFTGATMASAILSLAHLQLPASSRLLPSSWCPDKDLLVVVPRSGNKDRLSLWKMQGSKKWEVDVDSDNATQSAIVDIAWSPDGASIENEIGSSFDVSF